MSGEWERSIGGVEPAIPSQSPSIPHLQSSQPSECNTPTSDVPNTASRKRLHLGTRPFSKSITTVLLPPSFHESQYIDVVLEEDS